MTSFESPGCSAPQADASLTAYSWVPVIPRPALRSRVRAREHEVVTAALGGDGRRLHESRNANIDGRDRARSDEVLHQVAATLLSSSSSLSSPLLMSLVLFSPPMGPSTLSVASGHSHESGPPFNASLAGITHCLFQGLSDTGDLGLQGHWCFGNKSLMFMV